MESDLVSEAIRIAALELVAPWEGYHRKLPDGGCCAYSDPAHGWDLPTIGFGSTGPDIKRDTVWTRQQAEDRLMAHLQGIAPSVLRSISKASQVTPRRIAALLSFVYNVGSGNFRISSVRRYASTGEWTLAAQSLGLWTKAGGRTLPGLVARRKAEARYLA